MKFPELTYANPTDPWLKRAIIQSLEVMSGRNYFVPAYETWRSDYVLPAKRYVIRPMLDLIDVERRVEGEWPPAGLEEGVPLVIVANHPFGIVDGITALSLAEELGRPFRVLINKDLMKIPEIRPYSLPVDFRETREAQEANIRMRNEALSLLKAGTTIVIFPAGGVATAPSPWGRAVDLPWKTFTARLITAARAQVLPVYFFGQCGPLFHIASRVSLTLRLSMIVRELRLFVGRPIRLKVGPIIRSAELSGYKDRIALMQELYERVHRMSDISLEETRAITEQLPDYLMGKER